MSFHMLILTCQYINESKYIYKNAPTCLFIYKYIFLHLCECVYILSIGLFILIFIILKS